MFGFLSLEADISGYQIFINPNLLASILYRSYDSYDFIKNYMQL